MIEKSEDGISLLDGNIRTIYQSPAVQRLFGYSEGEARAIAWHEFVPAEEQPKLQAALGQLLAAPAAAVHLEFAMRHHDGGLRRVELSATNLLHDPDVRAIVANFRDVTERRAAERELESFFALSPDLLCIAGPDGRFRRLNDAWERTLGWSLDELRSRPWIEFVHPDDRAASLGVSPPRDGAAKTERFVNRYLCKDGSYRWLSWSSRRTPEDGLIYGTAHDVTAQRASAERDRMLFAESPFAKWLVDADMRFIDVNEALLRAYGYSRDEFLRMSLEDVVVPAELPSLREGWAEVMTRGTVHVARRHHRTKSGAVLEVEVTGKRMFMADRPVVLSSMRDFTHERRLELQLQQAQKMEAVGRLAGGVAHDFNNLLSVVLSYTDLMLRDVGASDRLRRDVEEVHRAGQRAAELTRQLLAFSRHQVLQPRVVDLNTVVGGMENMLRRLLQDDVELALLLAPGVGHVLADPGQLEQVIMNLAVNARDAMPAGGRLTIESADLVLDAHHAAEQHGLSPGAYVALTVSDTGTGIDASTMAHVFEPFFITKERGKGTGLGLSTVFGIVQQSGGHIDVRSEPGRGTSFRICLPRTNEAPTPIVAARNQGERPTGTETVLLVEDEDQVRLLVRTVLARAGYRVLEAANAGEALLIAEPVDARIDVLLTDLVMPRVSGRQLAERLRRTRPGIKVVSMSGYSDHAEVNHAPGPGEAFLAKPIMPDALLRTLRSVLDP